MTDLILTGANGQLGQEVTALAGKHGLSLKAFDRAALDISDPLAIRDVFIAHKPAVVLNAAAYTAVDRAETDEQAAFKANSTGPAMLAEVCADHDVGLIHVSTDYVFDGSKTGAYVETDPVAPLGVYGRSKEAGEVAVRQCLERHVILRTAWVYGVTGGNFVNTMLRLGGERDELSVVADQIGCPTFAADLADAALLIARQMVDGTVPDGGHGTFHCTGAGDVSWHGFAEAIFDGAKRQGHKGCVVHAILSSDYPTPAERPANSALDCTKLETTYGLKLRPWQDALADRLERSARKG